VLYFFRTPPSVRVGREPIDAEAMRLLESHNPDVEFDWPRLLKPSPPAQAPPAAEGPGRQREERRRDRRERRGRPEREASERAVQAPTDAPDFPEPTVVEGPEPSAEPSLAAAEVAAVEAPVESRPAEPASPVEEPEARPEEIDERYARIGAEGLRRLRARYGDLKARIETGPGDEAQRAEAFVRLERLNPDAWTSADEVAAALEGYEGTLDSLRPLLGRQPRGRR
jgi:hypothetical protein